MTDREIRQKAVAKHERPGVIVANDPVYGNSEGEPLVVDVLNEFGQWQGAWVQAWVWVPKTTERAPKVER